MSELLTNPTTTGLLGGLAMLVLQQMWNRLSGSNDEKSIPARLTEIDAKLYEINATLMLIKQNAEHDKESFEELKHDFWRHMDRYHSGHGGNGPNSGAHRAHTLRED